MSNLLELAQRCETDMSSPYGLSSEIGEALNDHAAQRYEHPGSQSESWPNYVYSVDAAMALVHRKLCPGILDMTVTWDTEQPPAEPAASIRWYPDGKSGKHWHAQTSGAPTAARAICSVLLKALHARDLQKAAAKASTDG